MPNSHLKKWPVPGALALTALIAAGAQAEEAKPQQSNHIAALEACQKLTDPNARLACLDAAAAQLVTAAKSGEVRLVDREQIQQTRRSLFGFSLPKIKLFGGSDKVDDGDEDIELLETTITRVRILSGSSFTFVTEEGAVWQVDEVPIRLRRPEPGDKVVFKKAALGSYFVRIDGQLGVKGKRIQ